MGVNSVPKTVTRQRRGCDLNPGPSALESSTLTTRLPSHLGLGHLQLTENNRGKIKQFKGVIDLDCYTCQVTILL